MQKYIVGHVEGPWLNFTPPIQYGKFRTLAQQQADDTNDEASSTSTSPGTTPIFDAALRHRNAKGRQSSSSSATSLSSLELASEPEESAADKRTRELLEADLAKYPSLTASVQSDIVQKYRELNIRIRDAGLYNCNYTAYAVECLRYTLLFSGCLLCLRYGQYALAGFFLGTFWHQLVFTAHDAGHMGITHDFNTDTVIGILIADFLGGLSLGWWKRNHNVHHIVTNSSEHDPDIQHMPFFAISHRFFQSLRSTYYDRIMEYDVVARFAVQYQHYLYYPILTLGRFNLYRLTWEYLLLGQAPKKGPAAWHRYLELLGQVFFWTWFGYGIVYRTIPTNLSRLAFVLVSHAVTMPLHVQITLSHFAMSTSDLGVAESFPQRMLRTTMDVDCPQWLDWFHGGLQFQAIHHLYPRIPRHNLRATQKMVQQFCDEVGIPYALYGFYDGNKEVIGRLEEVGRQAKILAECQKVAAKDPLGHQH